MTLFLSTVVAERFTGEIVFSLSYAMNGCLSGLVAIGGEYSSMYSIEVNADTMF
jgi:hypothetical protein